MCVVAVLQTLARTMEQERRLHDLKMRVAELRSQYSTRLADLRSGRGPHEIIEVSPVGDAPTVATGAAMRKAA